MERGRGNSAWRRHETESTMLMLGSMPHVPKELCPSVTSPMKSANVITGRVW